MSSIDKLTNKTFLVVEDEEYLRNLITDMIPSDKVNFILAENGAEALQIFHEKKDIIDALIVDLIMPYLDGIKLYEILSEKHPDIKVLFTSGYYPQLNEVAKYTKEGQVDFIRKPFQAGNFIEKLSGLFSNN